MAPESVEAMRVRRGNERFAKTRRHFFCAAVRIKEAHVKMAELDGVKAVYFLK